MPDNVMTILGADPVEASHATPGDARVAGAPEVLRILGILGLGESRRDWALPAIKRERPHSSFRRALLAFADGASRWPV